MRKWAAVHLRVVTGPGDGKPAAYAAAADTRVGSSLAETGAGAMLSNAREVI
jgi:hypothetical protein